VPGHQLDTVMGTIEMMKCLDMFSASDFKIIYGLLLCGWKYMKLAFLVLSLPYHLKYSVQSSDNRFGFNLSLSSEHLLITLVLS